MSVSAKGLVKGQKYTITIEGVMAKNATEPATITKTFVAKGMKTANKVSKATVKYNKFVILKLKTFWNRDTQKKISTEPEKSWFLNFQVLK